MAESISFEIGETPSNPRTSLLHVSPRARGRRDLTAECGLGDSRCCVRTGNGEWEWEWDRERAMGNGGSLKAGIFKMGSL